MGDTVRIVLTIGASTIQGGTTLTINRVRFNLDCNNSNLGLNCPDDGPVVSYQGNLISTCPSAFASSHSAGDVLPNQVVFTPASPIDIPAGAANFCTLAFDVRIETRSADGTPDVIEQVSGYDASLGDGVCNTTPPLGAGNTNSGSLRLCPQCDDGNQCNGVETCDTNLDCLPGTPITCNDNNVARPTAVTDIPAPNDPCVYTPAPGATETTSAPSSVRSGLPSHTDKARAVPAQRLHRRSVRSGPDRQHTGQRRCDDQVCMTDSCDPISTVSPCPDRYAVQRDNNVTDDARSGQGAAHDNSARCNDNNAHTDVCDPPPLRTTRCDLATTQQVHERSPELGDGRVFTPIVCNDNNACTKPTRATGERPRSHRDRLQRHNKCTNDSCDPATGCVNTPIVCNDNNACTNDSCDVASGCVYTAIDCNDHDKCTNDSCDPVKGCVHPALNCDDGNACTTDTCNPASGCTTTHIDCNDNNKCTNDSCNPATGCVNTPVGCTTATRARPTRAIRPRAARTPRSTAAITTSAPTTTAIRRRAVCTRRSSAMTATRARTTPAIRPADAPTRRSIVTITLCAPTTAATRRPDART